MSAGLKLDYDDREIVQLEVDLRKSPLRIKFGSRSAMRKSSKLVEAQMKIDARGHRYLPRFPRAVTSQYSDFDAEIGFEAIRGTQGRLAHIILYGSINNAPVYDYTAALRRSVPEILHFFGQEAEDAVLGRDGGSAA